MNEEPTNHGYQTSNQKTGPNELTHNKKAGIIIIEMVLVVGLPPPPLSLCLVVSWLEEEWTR